MKKITADYHMHSVSPDAREPMARMCEAACAQGLDEIAVTDHMELYAPDYTGSETRFYSREYMDDYFTQLAQCREAFAGRLVIRAGVELGQPGENPQAAAALLQEREFDFVLGSLHKIHNVDMAFKAYSARSLPRLCGEYLAGLYALADTGDFDVLAHFDLIKRYAARKGLMADVLDAREQTEAVLRRVIERGKGLEINTSGLRQGLGQTMPSLELLELYRAMGGEILTVGSDAHRAADVAAGMEDARELARAAGFTRLALYHKRKCSFYNIM